MKNNLNDNGIISLMNFCKKKKKSITKGKELEATWPFAILNEVLNRGTI